LVFRIPCSYGAPYRCSSFFFCELRNLVVISMERFDSERFAALSPTDGPAAGGRLNLAWEFATDC
jgi:hypothetical protein